MLLNYPRTYQALRDAGLEVRRHISCLQIREPGCLKWYTVFPAKYIMGKPMFDQNEVLSHCSGE